MSNYIRKKPLVVLSDEQFYALKRRYPDEDNAILSRDIGIPPGKIKWLATKHGWTKSEAWKVKNLRACSKAGKAAQDKPSEIERRIKGMAGRSIFSGMLYTKGNVIVHIGK